MRLTKHIISFATSLITSIIKEHKMLDIIYHMTSNLLKSRCVGMKTSRFCFLLSNLIMGVIYVI